ncbi:MAG: NTP transferase domain-containing protein [Candidatus Eisenbacteria bacterium]|nr:NTP transferase domain-containing protein [Candidatus Eisenbacteria bacterium]
MAEGTGVLLLANLDRRMLKTPRALLPFGDISILEKTLQAYEPLRPQEILVVSAASQEKLRAGLGAVADRITLVTSPDVRARVGQGIKLALERFSAQPDTLVIGLADQPLLTPELVEGLAARFRESAGTIGVPVVQNVPGHPMFVAAEHLPALQELEPAKTHRDLLLRFPESIAELIVDETAILRTAETPEDYREILRLAGLPEPPPPPAPARQKPEAPPAEETAETGAPDTDET